MKGLVVAVEAGDQHGAEHRADHSRQQQAEEE